MLCIFDRFTYLSWGKDSETCGLGFDFNLHYALWPVIRMDFETHLTKGNEGSFPLSVFHLCILFNLCFLCVNSHSCNPNTQKSEADKVRVRGHFGLPSKIVSKIN